MVVDAGTIRHMLRSPLSSYIRSSSGRQFLHIDRSTHGMKQKRKIFSLIACLLKKNILALYGIALLSR
jgi:hypothetical protein